MRKDDEKQKVHFRSRSRIFCMNGQWFFTSREGDKGPYLSEGTAHRELDRYAHEMSHLENLKKSLSPEESTEDFTLLDPKIWNDRPDAH